MSMPMLALRHFDNEPVPTFFEWIARNRRDLAERRAEAHAKVDRHFDALAERLELEAMVIERDITETAQH